MVQKHLVARKRLVAVFGTSEMGPGSGAVANAEAGGPLWDEAVAVGRGIAERGWILVCGGLGGVMEAAAKGASEAGGLVIGILPGPTGAEANLYVTVPIATNMGHARNVVLAHTADICVAIGGGYGTLSEIAIARKLGKTVIGLQCPPVEGVRQVKNAEEALAALGGVNE